MIFTKFPSVAVAFTSLWLLSACSDGVVLVPDDGSDGSSPAADAGQGFAVEADQPVLVADPELTQELAEAEEAAASDQTPSEQPANDESEQTTPESEPVEFVPASSEQTPVAFAPSESTPEPVVFTPAEPAPTEPVTAEPTPVEPTPTEPAPVEPAPTEPAPVEPTSTEPAPVEPTPTEPAPVEPTPTDPTPVEPAPTEPAPVEPTTDEPAPAETVGSTSPSPVLIPTEPVSSTGETLPPNPPQQASPAPPSLEGSHYEPPVLVTWHMQLSGILDTTYDAELYIVDLFNISSDDIESIQSGGQKVICSFSAGTYEVTRPDANQFVDADLGASVDGWPGQRWVNIKNENVRDIMINRLSLAESKGCDGVDPRNVDGYLNETGFDLTDSDQLLFTKVLSGGANGRDLAIGLRNDAGRAEELEVYYDFAVNDSCDVSDQCDELDVFIANGKPVLHVEYGPELLNSPVEFRTYCQSFNSKQFSALILPVELNNDYRLSCQE